MKASLIAIGNSRGIRIPKPVIEQCGLQHQVELRVEGRKLVVTPCAPRAGWEEAFAAARRSGPDKPMAWPRNRFDDEEWQW